MNFVVRFFRACAALQVSAWPKGTLGRRGTHEVRVAGPNEEGVVLGGRYTPDLSDYATIGAIVGLYEGALKKSSLQRSHNIPLEMSKRGWTSPEAVEALISALEELAEEQLSSNLVAAVDRAYAEALGTNPDPHWWEREAFIAQMARGALLKGISPEDVCMATYKDALKDPRGGPDKICGVTSLGTREQIANYTASALVRIEAALRKRYLVVAEVLELPVDAPLVGEDLLALVRAACDCPEISPAPLRKGSWETCWNRVMFYGSTQEESLIAVLERRMQEAIKEQLVSHPVLESESW